MINNWCIGGPLHGQVNVHLDSEVVYHHTVSRSDFDEWRSYADFDAPIRAMPVDVVVHTYYRRHIQFYGSNGNIWVDRDLDPRDLLPLVSALMGAARSSNGYAQGGWISGGSWDSDAHGFSERPTTDQVDRFRSRIESGQLLYPQVQMEVYRNWSLGQYGSPEAMADTYRRRTQQSRETAQAEWERRTQARQDGERPNLFLDDELFEQTIIGLTHSMRWSPPDPDNPDANRSHP